MIDNTFWVKVSEEWKKQDDGIVIPSPDDGRAGDINPNEDPFLDIKDEDIDDILKDFDL